MKPISNIATGSLAFALLLATSRASLAMGKSAHRHESDALYAVPTEAYPNSGRIIIGLTNFGGPTANSLPHDFAEGEQMPTPRTDAGKLMKSFQLVRQYFFRTFGFNSFDGRGGDIIVNYGYPYPEPQSEGARENAQYLFNLQQFLFRSVAQSSSVYDFMGLDVIAHEYTHAVIQHTSNLWQRGQGGALHEHFADLFGSQIENYYLHVRRPFLIGDWGQSPEDRRYIRDMQSPMTRGQPGTMDDFHQNQAFDQYETCEDTWAFASQLAPDNCGVHILSGIPNRAAAKIVSDLGWENVKVVYFRVMTERLGNLSRFNDYRRAMMDECKTISAPGSAVDPCKVIASAFDMVGIH
jgi:bacillolysin